MRAFKVSLLAAAMVVGAGAAAQAADIGSSDNTAADYGIYLRADAGWSFLTWSGGADDSAPTIGGGVGYRFNDNMRADVRADWTGDYSIGGGDDMSISSVLGNLYFDWPTGTAFTPYIGAGIGYGHASIDNASDKNGLTYGLMAGASVDLTQNLALDVGYRFRDVMSSGSDPMDHQVTAGLRFSF